MTGRCFRAGADTRPPSSADIVADIVSQYFDVILTLFCWPTHRPLCHGYTPTLSRPTWARP